MKLSNPITSIILSILATVTHSAPTIANSEAANIAVAQRQQSFEGPPGWFNFVGVNGNNQWAMVPMNGKIYELQNEAAQIVVKEVTSSNKNALCVINLVDGKDLIFWGRQTIQVANPAKVRKGMCVILT